MIGIAERVPRAALSWITLVSPKGHFMTQDKIASKMDSSWRTHPWPFLFVRNVLVYEVLMWAIAHNWGCWRQGGQIFLGLVSLFFGTACQKCFRGPETFRKLTKPSLTYTQTAIGCLPDTLVVRTSNKLIEAIKPQRQRVLRKPLLPAATDLHASLFSFIHPSGHLSFYPLFPHPPFLSLSPVSPSHPFWSYSPAMSLMPCQWASTEVTGNAKSTSPSRTSSSKTCQAIVVLNINSTHSTGWTHKRREGLLLL